MQVQATSKHSRVLKTSTLKDVLLDTHQTEPLINSNKLVPKIPDPQEIICQFFLDIVKQWAPDLVLYEFKTLFINPVKAIGSAHLQALKTIVDSKNEEEFKNTLKRSCYILLNNWILARHYQALKDLIQLISNSANCDSISSPSVKCLKAWLADFVNSQDYEELKLFVSRYENREQDHWKSRYTSYLLAPQYVNKKNSEEQRQAAKGLSKQLKDQFKFDLAMYTAHSESRGFNNKKNQNPTALGDQALRLVKKVIARRGMFSYENIANIFLKQTKELKYKHFKQGLLKYLFYSTESQGQVETLKTNLWKILEFIYKEADEEEINSLLLIKTCKRVIECLTIKNNGEPSSLFVSLASEGKSVTLAILLLKIILICPPTRTHLEVCLAKLIQYYEEYSQEECSWVINFLEVIRITLTIYTENVQFDLVNMEEDSLSPSGSIDGKGYRVFSRKYRK
ncbi:hypothetical protein NDI44_02355 [Trichocoleus sp. DQ-A3]|uniref:hypothetical protein n=1 Tax=Cyanophyceae TaxID=3028117 RepID=UPI001683B777|nr:MULTISPECIES: hypothetical protein [unclassified Coleofasciculus]MBD1901699.1 hypothetical protein [Coleofasciculus sp. FACHB-125]MBD2084692.1 hypothetical protein [Coleofasciculus sp. FACHB-542]MBD2537372.1 hypothetical protein [Coleofasciculus sp. FACHB-SPT36]